MIRKIALILEIIFILFISMFALDVFGQGGWFLVLLIHLIPTYILIILTVISWRWKFWGGILWLILGILFAVMSLESWIIYLPVIVIGGLNIWIGRKKYNF